MKSVQRSPIGHAAVAILAVLFLVAPMRADDSQEAAASSDTSKSSDAATGAEPAKYLLRYQFQPDEDVRWEVLQQSRIRSTIGGTTTTAEMVSKSVKVWRVAEVKPDGTATFENLVESVNMRNQFSGRKEERYNSQADEEPPPGFEAVAASIGVPISKITMNSQGEVVQRKRNPVKAAAPNEGQLTIPLPDEPVAVGHKWSYPYELEVPLEGGMVKKVKLLQSFKLDRVKTGVASINVSTKVLTPIHDPSIEAKLIRHESSGLVKFDVDAGRIRSQQLDLDRRVVGFAPTNPASSLHYLTRFTETLLPETAPETVRRPSATESSPRKR